MLVAIVSDLVVVVQKLADKLVAVKSSLSALTTKTSSTSSVSSQRVRELEDQLDASKNEVEDLRSQRSSLEKRIESMKTAAKTSREEMSAFQAEIESLKSEVDSQEMELSKAQATITKLQQQATKQQQELEHVSESSPEYQVLAEENLELFNENKKLSKEAATYKLQAERAQAQLTKLQVQQQQQPVLGQPVGNSSVDVAAAPSSAQKSSRKRSFGTDLSTRLVHAENTIKDVSPAAKTMKPAVVNNINSASKSLVQSSSIVDEPKKQRARAVAMVSTGTVAVGGTPVVAPVSVKESGEAAPEEGCAQS